MQTVTEWKVYRYKNSGKIFTYDRANGYAYPLNSDYSFGSREPHHVRFRSTPIEDTGYRLEIEKIRRPDGTSSARIVRMYRADRTITRSLDPASPLEERIDVSPS